MLAYGQSKTANILFAIELDRLGQRYGVRAFAVHPGVIQTDIFRYMTDEERQAWDQQVTGASRGGFKTLQQGAATSVWCALSEQLKDMGGDPKITHGVRAFALDPDKAAALWQLSEKVAGIRWP